MDVIGTKREKLGDPSQLKPLTIDGRPKVFPGRADLAVVFGYDKTFEPGRTEEVLVHCESLSEMQACHDRMHGKTRIVWYVVEKPAEPQFELVEYTTDDYEAEQDFADLL